MPRIPYYTLVFTSLISLGCARGQTQTPRATATSPASNPPTPVAELQHVSIDELAGLIDRRETVAIFDTNSHERYEQGHVPGARWVEHDHVTAEVLPPDRDARMVFYCANEH